MAFLGIGKKKQERRAQAANATIDKLISSGQKLSDSNIQTMVLAADGKISARDKKLIKKADKQANKTARTEIRQSYSLEKVAARADARKTAYQNGIDPRKYISDTAGKLAQGVVGVSTAMAFGKVGAAFAGRSPQTGGNSAEMSRLEGMMTSAGSYEGYADSADTPSGVVYDNSGNNQQGGTSFDTLSQGNNKWLLLAGAGLVLYFLMKRKK